MCKHVEMRKSMAPLGLPWQGGRKTRLGRYREAAAGPTREPGLHAEDVRQHEGFQAENEGTRFGFWIDGYPDEVMGGRGGVGGAGRVSRGFGSVMCHLK